MTTTQKEQLVRAYALVERIVFWVLTVGMAFMVVTMLDNRTDIRLILADIASVKYRVEKLGAQSSTLAKHGIRLAVLEGNRFTSENEQLLTDRCDGKSERLERKIQDLWREVMALRERLPEAYPPKEYRQRIDERLDSIEERLKAHDRDK